SDPAQANDAHRAVTAASHTKERPRGVSGRTTSEPTPSRRPSTTAPHTTTHRAHLGRTAGAGAMNSGLTYWKRANPSRNRKLRCNSKRSDHSTASARSGSPTFPSYHIRAAYDGARGNHINRSIDSRAQLLGPRSTPFPRCAHPLARRNLEAQ